MNSKKTIVLTHPFWVNVAAWLTITVGFLNWCGWFFEISELRSVLPGLASLKFNASLCFIALGLSLSLLTVPKMFFFIRGLSAFFALLVFLITGITLAEYAFDWDAGIDQLLFKEPAGMTFTNSPGRMAIIAAVMWNFQAVSLFLMMFGRFWNVIQGFALLSGLISLLPIGGYMFGNLLFPKIGNTSGIAAHAAIGIFLFSLGMLSATSNYGFVDKLRSKIMTIGIVFSFAMLVISIGAMFHSLEQRKLASNSVEHTYQILQFSGNVISLSFEHKALNRSFLLRGGEELLEQCMAIRKRIFEELNSLAEATRDDSGKLASVKSLPNLFAQLFASADKLVSLKKNQENFNLAALSVSETDNIHIQVIAKLVELETSEKELLKQQQRNVELKDSISKVISGFSLLVAMATLIGTTTSLYGEINRRKKSEEELLQHRFHLEKLVSERTAELNKAKEAAEAANIAKSTFIATMSHELRTPLNSILGFSEIMQYDSKTHPEQKEILTIINRCGGHLLSMINEILDLSKIEAGRLELEVSCFDLIKMVQDIETFFQHSAATNQLQFIVEIEENVPRYIETDNKKLRQILINFLSNAMKFTPQGRVTLRVHTDLAQKNLLIDVIDTGIGISEANQKEIFKPFVQVGAGNTGAQGTGLGLAITESLVKLMGGKLTLVSELSKGSTFSVALPLKLANASQIEIEQEWQNVKALAPNQTNWKILVVDDNSDNRKLLVSLLTTVGFEIREAENGAKAVDVFKQWQPHFIWMDLRMPVMDGYEATAKIRQLENSHTVKIVALTAGIFKEQNQDILDAGCDDVLSKPFRTQEIFAMLKQQLGVEYVFEHEVKSPKMIAAAPQLNAENLKKLPIEMREKLFVAALNLSTSEMGEITTELAELFPDIAVGLRELTEHFEFNQLIQMLEQRSVIG